MTIAEKLDILFPVNCLICGSVIKRHGNNKELPCPKCGLSQNGAEASGIMKFKQANGEKP